MDGCCKNNPQHTNETQKELSKIFLEKKLLIIFPKLPSIKNENEKYLHDEALDSQYEESIFCLVGMLFT